MHDRALDVFHVASVQGALDAVDGHPCSLRNHVLHHLGIPLGARVVNPFRSSSRLPPMLCSLYAFFRGEGTGDTGRSLVAFSGLFGDGRTFVVPTSRHPWCLHGHVRGWRFVASARRVVILRHWMLGAASYLADVAEGTRAPLIQTDALDAEVATSLSVTVMPARGTSAQNLTASAGSQNSAVPLCFTAMRTCPPDVRSMSHPQHGRRYG